MESIAEEHDLRERIGAQLPGLRRYARALLRWQDGADDLVQETVLRGISRAHQWKPDTNLRAWLFTIMHNQYVNRIRAAAREGKSTSLNVDAARDIGDPPPQLAVLRLRDLEAAIDALSPEQRAIILLVGLEDMSYEDVAAVMNIPIGTVRSRLSRAREALRRMMDGMERRRLPRRGLRLLVSKQVVDIANASEQPVRT